MPGSYGNAILVIQARDIGIELHGLRGEMEDDSPVDVFNRLAYSSKL